MLLAELKDQSIVLSPETTTALCSEIAASLRQFSPQVIVVRQPWDVASLLALFSAILGGHFPLVLPPKAADRYDGPLLRRFPLLAIDSRLHKWSLGDQQYRVHDALPGGFASDTIIGHAVQLTGGSTAQPKLGSRKLKQSTLGALREAAITARGWVGIGGGGTHIVTGPLWHSGPRGLAVAAMLTSQRIVITRSLRKALTSLLHESETDTFCTPGQLALLLRLSERWGFNRAPDSLRMLVHGADRCSMSLKQAAIAWAGAERVTETFASAQGPISVVNGHEWLRKPGTVGRPLAHVRVKVLEHVTKEELGAGHAGSLYIAGLRDGSLVNETVSVDGRSFVSIGDRGYVDRDGYIYIIGRTSEVVKIRGRWFDLGRLNHLAESMTGVSAARSAVREDGGIVLMCAALPGVDHGLLESSLIAVCRRDLPPWASPRAVHIFDSLPQTGSGKFGLTEPGQP